MTKYNLSPLEGGAALAWVGEELVGYLDMDFDHEVYIWKTDGQEGSVPFGDPGSESDDEAAQKAYDELRAALDKIYGCSRYLH